ncbi:Monofunctional biosynthetic peptidoglycan transglycosylase [Castellaniella defragrans 65Phen]|uniref:Biosynthetic peptidoglycan transglycosylase n=2 Tax=Castellaniella defragrans TaxID=75697 RepID=W8X677_CASD6|nr:monofunctional biosynthetic peptidoglycan transglycosylase [Castellaniella defragrans]KAB0607076.1 monofunctional biosynthetic peptidoglycan transglycosylase [Castellaniella defragrans]MBB6084640.1 monofunctional biosynthetic peptidoglycan transglycosylase [Castellaniella defragrans]CDM25986.1 Monofunctional biosynthetic peptidoglycan transglycosylase [Castellaniella defragrans 65Phen]
MSAPGRKIITTVLLAALCAAFLYQIGLLGMVVWFNFRNPSATPIMRDTLNALRADDPQARLAYEWVPYERISTHLKRAVIASEDSGFVDHDGVEWDAIRKAWTYNQRQADLGRARRRGGSTITQQLAKNLFLSNSRNYLRKGQELILTYMIEGVMSKRRILELYLNVAQWGAATFGAQAAARHYFRTDAARLSAGQASRLAAMLPNPAYYDRHGATAYLQSHAATVRARMRQVAVP